MLAAALFGSFAITFGAMYFVVRGKRAAIPAGETKVATATAKNPTSAIQDSLRREELKWEERIEAYRNELFDIESLKTVTDSLASVISQRQARLAELTAEIDQAEAMLQATHDQRIKKLAGIFSSMQPAAIDSLAARIDDNVMAAVLLAMRERSAAKVLAALSPSRAARIARKMTVKLR